VLSGLRAFTGDEPVNAKAKVVVAIDPGPERSALLRWDGSTINVKHYANNAAVLSFLRDQSISGEPLVTEQIACYGMAVGAEVFEIAFWSGRFAEAYGADRVSRIPRLQVKLHLCHDSRAKDANIRQALIDRFGKPGTKKQPGLLYGITGDLWAALALAVTWLDLNAEVSIGGSAA